jgi:hypothetical protein
MFDLKSPLLGWWLISLLLPFTLSIYLLYLALVSRARLLTPLAILSCLFAILIGVLYPLSRSADCYFQFSWNNPQRDGTVHHWFLTGDSVHGGVGICLRGSSNRPAALGLAQLGRDPAGEGWGPFPIAESKYALFHAPFLEAHGVQLCINPYLPADHNFALYSLSVPLWFLFLLTPWFPLAWYFRRRARLRAPGFPVSPITRLYRLAARLRRRPLLPQPHHASA